MNDERVGLPDRRLDKAQATQLDRATESVRFGDPDRREKDGTIADRKSPPWPSEAATERPSGLSS